MLARIVIDSICIHPIMNSKIGQYQINMCCFSRDMRGVVVAHYFGKKLSQFAQSCQKSSCSG